MDIFPDSSSYLPKDSQVLTTIIDCQEYYLLKDNAIYKLIIGKNNAEIFIKNKNYIFSFNQNDLSILIRAQINTIDEAYDYIINIFDLNQVYIKSILIHQEMKLVLKISEEKEIKLTLKYKTINQQNIGINDFIINELKQLNEEIKLLKMENSELKNEIKNLKRSNPNPISQSKTKLISNINISSNDIINSNNNNSINIKFVSSLSNNSFGYTDLDNSFITFKSLQNIQYLIYASLTKSMIIFNLGTNKIIKEIKNCHDKHITNFRHILDKKESRDLVMSVSSEENNIKIWEVKTWNCISNLEKINYKGLIYSACFYSDLNNNVHVVSSNRNKTGGCEPVKIFDLNGYIVQEIKESKEQTYFIDIYSDEILNKNFIVTGNVGLVKSYDIVQNKLYHIYCENNELNSYCHFSVVIKNIRDKIEMIESCFDGWLRIWDFHIGNLLKKIKISNEGLRGICVHDDNILFVGCDDKKIKVVDIENKNVIMNLSGHNNEVISIKKFKHDKFGECIVSQNGGESPIYLWKIE